MTGTIVPYPVEEALKRRTEPASGRTLEVYLVREKKLNHKPVELNLVQVKYVMSYVLNDIHQNYLFGNLYQHRKFNSAPLYG